MERERYLELHIEGESAKVINWPEYRAWASPDLNLTISADAATVSGTIVMPRADIEVRSLPESAVQVSPDVIVLGQVAPEETGMRIAGEVDLVLGDAVRIDAFGLEARLTGGLSLRLVPERPITARGQIVLRDGILGSFGRNLTLRDGELTFTGPLDDPLVDALAVREFDNRDEPVTVGLQLSGRATNLTTTLFSQPAMSDADILSYLIAGRPLEQSFALGTGAINDAATTFGVNPAGLLVGQVGRMVGLDELSVTTDADDATGLVAGTQINDRLYARYTYNTFSRLGVLLLRYRLSDQFTLEAGAGDDQSIDILYTIERE
jgi:translocation and assembly module TamB